MTILLLVSLGLNAVFIRSHVKREQRRRNREHKRYRLAFMDNLRRIHADWTPGLPEVQKGQNT